MGFPRLDVAHISFPHAHLLMTGQTRVPLALLPAPFLVNLASLSWGEAFLDVPQSCYLGTCFLRLTFSCQEGLPQGEVLDFVVH